MGLGASLASDVQPITNPTCHDLLLVNAQAAKLLWSMLAPSVALAAPLCPIKCQLAARTSFKTEFNSDVIVHLAFKKNFNKKLNGNLM